MREILIVNSNTYSDTCTGVSDISSLVAKSLTCIEETGTLVSGTSPAPTADKVFFAVGRSANGSKISQMIDRASLVYSKEPYVAPVAKIMQIGNDVDSGTTYNMNYPSVLVVGSVASITVIDKSKPHEDRSREKRYEYVVKAGDTNAKINLGLYNAIVADTNAIVTPEENTTSTTHYGIKLTGKTAGIDFTAVPGDIIKDADVLEYQLINGVYSSGYTTYATATKPGLGTYAQIAKLEQDLETEFGKRNALYEIAEIYTNPAMAESGVTYTQYTLQWTSPDNGVLIKEGNPTQELIIAVNPSHTATIAAIDAILAAL